MKIEYNTTLKELLDFCAEPDDINERATRLKDVAAEKPAFQTFLDQVFNVNTKVAQVDVGKIPPQKPVAKLPNRQEVDFTTYYTKEYKHFSEERKGPRHYKRGRFLRIADFLDPRDFVLLTGAIEGKFAYENKKINEVVVALAFPEMFPNA